MTTIRLTFLLLVLITGCRGKNRIPDGVLPQEKMQVVLWDMMRADQFLADYVLNKDSTLNKTTESLKYYQKIFAIHKISKEEFQESFSFYQSHPVLLKTILDSISAPPANEAPTKSILPEQVTEPVIAQPDTGINNQSKMPQDTGSKRIKKNNLAY